MIQTKTENNEQRFTLAEAKISAWVPTTSITFYSVSKKTKYNSDHRSAAVQVWDCCA